MIDFTCERCGKTLSMRPAKERRGDGGVRDVDDGEFEAFRSTFNFCMRCRHYVCTDCWDNTEGACLTCVAKANGTWVDPAVAAAAAAAAEAEAAAAAAEAAAAAAARAAAAQAVAEPMTASGPESLETSETPAEPESPSDEEAAAAAAATLAATGLAPEAPHEPPAQDRIRAIAPPPPPPGRPVAPPPGNGEPEPLKPRVRTQRRSNAPVLLGGVAILVVAGGVGAFALLSNRQPDQTAIISPTPIPTATATPYPTPEPEQSAPIIVVETPSPTEPPTPGQSPTPGQTPAPVVIAAPVVTGCTPSNPFVGQKVYCNARIQAGDTNLVWYLDGIARAQPYSFNTAGTHSVYLRVTHRDGKVGISNTVYFTFRVYPPSPTPAPTAPPTQSPTPAPTSTATPSPTPTDSPTPTPTDSPTPVPTDSPTPVPTPTPPGPVTISCSPNPQTLGGQVDCTITSADPSPDSYSWEVDGVPSGSLSTFSWTPSSAATYSVTVTLSYPGGSVTSNTESVVINP